MQWRVCGFIHGDIFRKKGIEMNTLELGAWDRCLRGMQKKRWSPAQCWTERSAVSIALYSRLGWAGKPSSP